ncbi:MAG: peptidoglycan recognition family protein [Chloroflexi bacterium]|nr:peptidoglycan recognition family protein [Chloroflexota bacterium]
MTTPTSKAAPDLAGIDGLPAGARTIWRPAHESNFYAAASRPYSGADRRFVAICYHTPEEPWDDNEVTPMWFEDPRANASTNYYADSDGDLYQMVRDADFAWAQGVRSKDLVLPRPSWWRDEYVSYNACMLSIEIEGYAREIGETFVPGSRQFETVAAWSAHLCAKYDIPIDRRYHVGHSELTRQKSDPGRDFPWEALLDRVRELSSSDPEARLAQLERRVALLESHTHGAPLGVG